MEKLNELLSAILNIAIVVVEVFKKNGQTGNQKGND